MGMLDNTYRLAEDGNFLRDYARAENRFIYPYDILTGADIGLFENVKAKEEKHRYIICTLKEMKLKKGKLGEYGLDVTNMLSPAKKYSAATLEGALELWNQRMQEMARALLKPFPLRFIELEFSGMFANVIIWGIIWAILSNITPLVNFLREHIFTILFMLLCSNLIHIFTKPYGAEIPRQLLQEWAEGRGRNFSESFHNRALAGWQDFCERHEKSLPYYLLWRRGMLKAPQEAAWELPQPAEQKDSTYEDYSREISAKFARQLEEIKDRSRKISDRAVRRFVEDILKVLGEIRKVLRAGDNPGQVIAARKVVSYWNEETISLLDSYMLLLDNSSQEAGVTLDRVTAMLQEMAPVYRQELGRITTAHTMEMKASMDVLQQEIDEVLRGTRIRS